MELGTFSAKYIQMMIYRLIRVCGKFLQHERNCTVQFAIVASEVADD